MGAGDPEDISRMQPRWAFFLQLQEHDKTTRAHWKHHNGDHLYQAEVVLVLSNLAFVLQITWEKASRAVFRSETLENGTFPKTGAASMSVSPLCKSPTLVS